VLLPVGSRPARRKQCERKERTDLFWSAVDDRRLGAIDGTAGDDVIADQVVPLQETIAKEPDRCQASGQSK